MNKTININLGGIFFHIDEEAYQKLRRYLDAIRNSLSDDAQGKDEILNDIELRISELLSERIKNDRQVVNENDIDEITKIMGKPEDYLVDEETSFESTKSRKSTSSKKLFRDGDDKFLGGVCSGLGHYFGIDPLWIRILWLILLFGFGIGFLIYPLLWILIPLASTTAEKLQMKGEPVNISNIERKIREEFQDVSSRVKDGFNDVTEKVKSSEFRNKAKSGIQEVVETLGNILISFFKVIGKLIGALLIFIASITLIGLLIGAFSVGSFEILGFGNEFVHYPPFIFNSFFPSWLLVIFLFIAISIPFVVLFMLGLKIISNNIKSFSTATKLSLFGIWIIALLGLAFAGINFATQHAYTGYSNATENLPIKLTDTLKVKMVTNDSLPIKTDLYRRHDATETVLIGTEEKLYTTNITLNFVYTDSQTPSIKIRKQSEGSNRLSANTFADNLEYSYKITNNTLELNNYFLSNIKNKFKDQQINITLYLPKNEVIYLDNSTKSFLNDVDNVQDINDWDMPKHFYKMTADGLECLDCSASIYGKNFDKEHFNLNIDNKGVHVNINDGEKNATIKIDKHGVEIK